MKRTMIWLLVLTILLGWNTGGVNIATPDYGHEPLHDHAHEHSHVHQVAPMRIALPTMPVAKAEAATSASGRSITLLANQSSDAELARGEAGDTSAPSDGMRMISGDAITSGSGTVFFQVDEDKLFELEPASSVSVTQADDATLVLTLSSGGMYFYIKQPLLEGESLEMYAGTTSMSIRGTVGYIKYTEGDAEFFIFEGRGEVKVKDRTINVRPGRRVRVTRDANGTETVDEDDIEDLSGYRDLVNRKTCHCEKEHHLQQPCGHYACSAGHSPCSACRKLICPSDGINHGRCALCGGNYCVGSHGSGGCVFDCAVCGETNINMSERENHGNGKCRVDVFDCPFCNKTGIPNAESASHGDGKCNVFNCPYCNKNGIPNADKSKHGNRKCNVFNCDVCNRNGILNSDKPNHGVGKCDIFTCNICGQTNIPIADRSNHGAGKCDVFTCDVCGQTNIPIADKPKHGAGKCDVFTCDICGQTNIPVAEQSKHGAGKCDVFDCPVCGRTNIPIANTSAHGAGICNGTFTCSVCGATGIPTSQSSSHGEGICLFDCTICGQTKIGIANRAQHEPQLCSLCGDSYALCDTTAGKHGIGTSILDGCRKQCRICQVPTPFWVDDGMHEIFTCIQCGVEYCLRSDELSAPHLPNNCEVCDKPYRYCDLSNQNHGTGICDFVCEKCDKKFLTLAEREANHGYDKCVIKCDKCNQTFLNDGSHIVCKCEFCEALYCSFPDDVLHHTAFTNLSSMGVGIFETGCGAIKCFGCSEILGQSEHMDKVNFLTAHYPMLCIECTLTTIVNTYHCDKQPGPNGDCSKSTPITAPTKPERKSNTRKEDKGKPQRAQSNLSGLVDAAGIAAPQDDKQDVVVDSSATQSEPEPETVVEPAKPETFDCEHCKKKALPATEKDRHGRDKCVVRCDVCEQWIVKVDFDEHMRGLCGARE